MPLDPLDIPSGMSIDAIAKVAHEANRAYCASMGDASQVPWEQAPQWQKDSCIAGVKWRLEHPALPASSQHEAWCQNKYADGWSYGKVKDANARTHPCLVPWHELKLEQRRQDVLFANVVSALRASL